MKRQLNLFFPKIDKLANDLELYHFQSAVNRKNKTQQFNQVKNKTRDNIVSIIACEEIISFIPFKRNKREN